MAAIPGAADIADRKVRRSHELSFPVRVVQDSGQSRFDANRPGRDRCSRIHSLRTKCRFRGNQPDLRADSKRAIYTVASLSSASHKNVATPR